MTEFSRYYMEFLRSLFQNIWNCIKTIFQFFADILWNNNIEYFKQLFNSWSSFNFLDWLFLFVVFVINTALIGFLALRLFQLIRRYVRFSRREIEKDALLEEIANLNIRTAELLDEKNKIMAMKVSNLGLSGVGGGGISINAEHVTGTDTSKTITDANGQTIKQTSTERFSKLMAVDAKYANELSSVIMETEDNVELPELVSRFINFAASQLHLYYDPKVIRTYFAGMATSKILILEGISGTGKTSLPYAMGKFFKNDSAIISVQPSWRDRAEMIGYLNEFTKRFNETDFLKALYEVNYRDDINFIVLDEMNLARIEYYFAEFLSIMEMPNAEDWLIDIVPDAWSTDPKLFNEGKLLVPQNVWFIGTANRDDSTFTITDKVYDRATSIEMNRRADFIDAPYTNGINMTYDYLNLKFKEGQSAHPISAQNVEKLLKVDEFIAKNFKITFGNRIMKQINLFVPAFVACGGSELEGIDYIFTRKILRKFESLNIAFLKEEVAQLISLLNKLYGKDTFASSIAYLTDLVKQS